MPLLSSPLIVIPNSAGQPYALAKIYTYRAGTLTPLQTFTDSTSSFANSNPVEADANGLFPQIYIDPALGYNLRIIAKDQNDVAIPGWDVDNIERAEGRFGNVQVIGNLSVTGTAAIVGNAVFSGLITQGLASPRRYLLDTNATTDRGMWEEKVAAYVYTLATVTDAAGAGKNAIKVTRGTNTAIASIEIGNATDLPTITLNGLSLPAVLYAVKTASTARSGTVTLADDPHLTLSLPIGKFAIEMWCPMWCTTANTGGFKISTAYAGSSSDGYFGFLVSSVTDDVGSTNTLADSYVVADPIVAGSINASGWVKMFGTITTTTAGTFAIEWAQSTSDANAVNLGIGGWIKATKIG